MLVAYLNPNLRNDDQFAKLAFFFVSFLNVILIIYINCMATSQRSCSVRRMSAGQIKSRA